MNPSLLSGPLPWLLYAAGVAGLVGLLWGRSQTWWRLKVPLAVGLGLVVAVVVKLVVDHALDLFSPEDLGWAALVAIGLIVLAVALALLKESAWRRRWIALIAVVGVILGSVTLVNSYFSYYPDVGSLFGQAGGDVTNLPSKTHPSGPSSPSSDVSTPPATGPIEARWTPPPGLRTQGTLSQVTIPGTVSGWNPGRPDWVYLPPAAYADNVPDLPVLMLLPGDPGSPDSWAVNLKVGDLLDAYAAQHHGLAPIVVIADSRGTGADPECVDSKVAGNVFTFLTKDVPAWVAGNVPHAMTDTRKWAVGGLSAGGTCGLQLVVNAPQEFKTFVNYSGLDFISWSSAADAIANLFNGDAKAYAAVNPKDVLQNKKFPDAAGFVSVGDQDGSRANVEDGVRLARAAGLTISFQVVSGGHTGPTWSAGLVASLPWLGQRLGLTS